MDLLVAAVFSCMLIILPTACSESDTNVNTQVFDLINEYRVQVANVTALLYNTNAACVAQQVVLKYKNNVCSNSTGADTGYGQEPQFSDYPNMLAKCGTSIANVTAGFIAPNCIPSGINSMDLATTVVTNFTHSQYQKELNSTDYASAGVDSSGIWYVVVFATNTSDGNFGASSEAKDMEGDTGHREPITLMMNVMLVLLVAVFTGL